MPTLPDDGHCLDDDPAGHTVWPVSTTWRSPRGTVTVAARPHRENAPEGRRLRTLRPRNPRDPLLTTLKWRGGPEAWVEIKTRGATVRVPGHANIAELVLLLNSQGAPR